MQYYTLKEFCQCLSISTATGRNWLRMHKITPDYSKDGQPYFSKQYTTSYQELLKSGVETALHSRRNKSYCSGRSLYSSYIAVSSPNFELVEQAVEQLQEDSISTDLVSWLLAECALRMLYSVPHSKFHDTLPRLSTHESFLAYYLKNTFCCTELAPLINALIPHRSKADKWISVYPVAFTLPYTYVSGEDTLGFLYMSLRTLQTKKQSGAYYTPRTVVEKLIGSLNFDSTSPCTILDPGCGSGNFLLQLPSSLPLDSIHGTDIDFISIALTRLNLILRELTKESSTDHNPGSFDPSEFFHQHVKTLRKTVRVANFLQQTNKNLYTHIIGNPPWGYSFSVQELEQLKPQFTCIGRGRTESYDLFIEHALSLLKVNGILSFVLPEAVLSVKSHRNVRQLMCQYCSFTAVTYLGECFSGVQCPSVVLTLTKKTMFGKDCFASCLGMKVETLRTSFTIQKERLLTPECLSFSANDTEYLLLQKLIHTNNVQFLANHTDFALGIVTGNNKEFIHKKESTSTNVTGTFADSKADILLGTDISLYHVEAPSYLLCRPLSECQQAAPKSLYEAPEKLIYRFIFEYPVFAYDNKKTLLLNSCNLILPHMKGFQMKYILAILNSRITRFLYCLTFHSLKVLRSYLEQLPIPEASEEEQNFIVSLVDCLISAAPTSVEYSQYYEQLEQRIARLFELNNEEYKIICNSLLHLDFCPFPSSKTP